jgi:uncharacterized protein YbbC (DUF1343 family)
MTPRVATGLDRLLARDLDALRGRSVGVVCNQATISAGCGHVLDLLLPAHRRGEFRIAAVFGPEHGLYGHTQDNMIEWEGEPDPRTGFVVHSLYGHRRKPAAEWLAGVELLVVDLPDIGSRYYTFAWTMAHCLEACAELGIPVLVLDRPNPIDGVHVEGPVLRPGFESFVGLHPVPTRHGMTLGEIARWLDVPGLDLKVLTCEGWDRRMLFADTGLPWAMPSPNMPTPDTALVYPGGCLFEATNLSEGRGTTRPFEIVGAPWIDGWRWADDLHDRGLPGVRFRPLPFEPTFNKHRGRLCGGVALHVVDPDAFRPVLTAVAMLQEAIRQTGLRSTDGLPPETVFRAESGETTLDGFAWRRPPYEYEHGHAPIELLAGNDALRGWIDENRPLGEIAAAWEEEIAAFAPSRAAALLY